MCLKQFFQTIFVVNSNLASNNSSLFEVFRKLSNKISLTEFFNEPEGNFQTSRLVSTTNL